MAVSDVVEEGVLDEVATAAREATRRARDESEVATVSVEIDGVEVTATVSPGGESRIVAPAAGAADLSLKFYPEGFTSALGKVFGAQDVEVGESRFDDRYMIKASDESLARLWLSHDVRKRIGDAHPEDAVGPFLVELEAEQVVIAWTEPHDAERLEAALRAAAALGGRAKALLRQCEAIADELGGTVMGAESHWWPGVSISVVKGEVEVLIDHVSIALESRQPSLHTRFTCSSLVEPPRRAVICRPNAQKRASKLLGANLFERSTGDRDLSFHYWIGVESWRDVKHWVDREMTKLLLEAMPVAVAIEEDSVAIYHEGFLDLDDEVKLHRTLALTEVLSGAPREEERAGKRSRRAGTVVSRTEPSRVRRAPKRAAAGASRPATSRPTTLSQTWAQIAGSFEGATSSDGVVEVEVDGVRVTFWEGWWGDGQRALQLAAPSPGSQGLHLRLIEGQLDPLSSFLGTEDIEIGDKRFDDNYVIKANDEGYAKLWLGSRVRELVLGTRDVTAAFGYDIQVRDEQVQMIRRMPERDPGRLEHAIRAAAALGSRSDAIVGECAALAEELGGSLMSEGDRWDPETGVPIVVGEGHGAVTISQGMSTSLSKRPRLLTHVHLARHGSSADRYVICKHDHLKRCRKLVGGGDVKLESFTSDDAHFNFLYWAGGENREALVWRLDERMLSRTVLSEPEALVASEHEISMWFLGFVDDLERLRRVMKLLDGLGEGVVVAGPAGPYR